MATSFRYAAGVFVLGLATAVFACSGNVATVGALADGGDDHNTASGSGGGNGSGGGGTTGGSSNGAGGDSGGTSGGGDVTADQACADLASSLCAKLQTCAPFLVAFIWGDEAGCVAREKLGCPALFNAPGTGITASKAEACAPAYTAASCEELVGNKTPSACAFHGSAPLGAACANDAQCSEGTYCDSSGGQRCGICTQRVPVGGTCRADSGCQQGLVCAKANNSSTGSCVVPGGPGAVCDATRPCLITLGCTSAGVCGAPLGAGAPCTAQACDSLRGLYCNPATHICGHVQIAGPGSPCGYSMVDGSYAVCGASGRCALATGSTTNGTCEAAAADGQACDATRGPPCRPPAYCAAGTCTLPSADCH